MDRRPPCLPGSLPRPPLQVPSKQSSSSKADHHHHHHHHRANQLQCSVRRHTYFGFHNQPGCIVAPSPGASDTRPALWEAEQVAKKKSTNPQKQFCDSPERNFCRPVAASSWCEEGLNLLKEMVVVPNLTWPGDGDSPIPGTGGGDLR